MPSGRRPLACVLAASVLAGGIAAQDEDRPRRIRRFDVSTRDVFTDAEADGNILFALANLLHVPTDPVVLRRDAWFGPGDEITEAAIAEYERALRRTRLFGEVEAEILEVDEDEVDVVVDSRDRLSLILSGGVAFVGGDSSVSGAIGEANLFGSGKSILAEFSSDDDNTQTVLSYFDRQFLDGTHGLSVAGGQTDEGPIASVGLTKPFRNRYDRISYGTTADYRELDIDYYRAGEIVSSLPTRRASAGFFSATASGEPNDRRTLGTDFSVLAADYEPATGPEAAGVRVPGDTTEVSVGVFGGLDTIWQDLKLQGIDALDFVEDIQLRLTADARVGGLVRSEDGRGTELQPQLSGSLRFSESPAANTYVTVEARGAARWYAGDVQGWELASSLHVFNQSLPCQTLAASLSFDGADEQQGPEVQFTLGEDNGLRGYPARQFAGSRFVRLNVEDRIRTGLEVLSVHIGLAAFFDAAWVHSDDLSMSDAIRSVGVGLRFGSSHLVGRRVFRLDLAFPLDDVNGQSFDASVSFAAGQVFGFFGNDAVLQGQF